MESLPRIQFDPVKAQEILVTCAQVIGILLVTWILAKIAKWAFAKLVDNVAFFQRDTSSGASIGASLGKIVSLFIWLFGLLAVFNVLNLEGVAGPINALLENIVSYIPNLIGAGIIAYVGFMIAGIVRDIVVTTAQTFNLDKWANKGGVDDVTGDTPISNTLGTIIYVLIAIPVAIAALDKLNIAAISVPATQMLSMILYAIPNIIAAAVLLAIGYYISKFIAKILAELLAGLGVDRALDETELLSKGTKASSVIARIVQIAIILFFAIAATRMLGFPELTAILNAILELGGQVIFGAVVIGAGFLIANLLARLVGGASEGAMAGTIVRWATIVMFTFMGLSFTGVGDVISTTAFSALVIGIAVAGALAFGLGGREWAARKLDEWDNSKK